MADRGNDRKMHSLLVNNAIAATGQTSWLRLCKGDSHCRSDRGATTAEKLRGTKVWVPTQGPRPAKGRAGCSVREVPPPAVRVRGIIPGKFFKN